MVKCGFSRTAGGFLLVPFDPGCRAVLAGAVSTGAAWSVPGAAIAATEGASDAIVVNGLDPSALSSAYLIMLKTGGVGCWHQSVGNSFTSFARLFAFFDANKAAIAPARSVRDIRRIHHEGRIAHISGWQSASGLLVDGEPALGNLRAYREVGLRVCGISYNVADAFGGGCFDPDVGLTRAGQRLVEAVHGARLVLDVAGHTNEKTSFQAIAMSSGVPIICSHSNVRALNDNPRCNSDAMFEAIARTGGVIGVSAFSDFHIRKTSDAKIARSPQASLALHLDQYDHLKKLVGVDHIGIGPDFLHGRNDEVGPLSPADQILMAAEAYSQETPWYYVQGFENIGQLPNVAHGLAERGWTDTELRKLMGDNWLRVYEAVWGE